MNFMSLHIILPISGSNFYFKQKAVYMAPSGWQVPLRTDLVCEPSDFKRIGWFRSARVGSVSDLMWTARSRSNGWSQIGT
jgi:hypothetical protein